MKEAHASYDVIIVGGGLSGSLTALALKEAHPDVRLIILEKAGEPSQSHTWSFHKTDLDDQWLARLAPYWRAHWQGQIVRFPQHSRQLDTGYATLDPAGLARALKDRDIATRHGAWVQDVGAHHVQLSTGENYSAPLVLDARGYEPRAFFKNAWQKFLGVEYETSSAHGLASPIIMDATIPQIDGYRFIYVLPMSPTRLLIEDTYYSNHPKLDIKACKAAIEAYAAQNNWQGEALREECGVLPIPLAQNVNAFWSQARGGALPIGMRAALFHPVTGYSLPDATRCADIVAQGTLTSEAGFERLAHYAKDKARRDRYFLLLNRMFFLGARPENRYKIMERFYRLPAPLIERFYAGQLTRRDQLRILTGKPPIKISQAIKCIPSAYLLEARS